MKNMKRILALAMTLVMVCGLLVVPAAAVDADVTFTVGECVQEGNKVSVTVTVAGKNGDFEANSLGVSLKFNTDVLTFTGSEAGEGMTGFSAMPANVDTSNTRGKAAVIFRVEDLTDHTVAANTVAVTYSFEVKANVESCEVTFEMDDEFTTASHGTEDYEVGFVNNLGAAIKGAAPTLDTVTLAPNSVEVNGTTGGTAKATATSTSSKDVTGFVTWSVAPVEQGVTVAADGTITVDAKAVAGAYTVTATPKDGETLGTAKTATLTVTRVAAAVTTVEISGSTTALIPAKAEDPANEYTYTAKVLDQYGDEMTAQTVTWTGDVGSTGVTFDATAAKLTVPATAQGGTVTITATCGSVSATLKVTVTNIAFEGVETGVKATDGVYGATMGDLVKLDSSKLSAVAGDKVPGTFSVKDADVIPDAAAEVPYTVVFNSTDGTYKDIEVTTGTVKVDPKPIVVTAKDVSVRVRTDVADVKAEMGYTATELVGEDKLTGEAVYTLYALNDDGTVSATAVALDEDMMEEVAEYAIVVSGLALPNENNYTLTFSDAGRLEVRKKVSTIPSGSTTPSTDEDDKDKTTSAFDDVTADDWFFEAVNYVAENGLMNGVAEKTFAPNETTTRAMIATILWRHAGSPAPRARIADFPDLDLVNGTWYLDAVRWCAEQEVVTGYEDGTFGPQNEITREQLAAMLYRYAGSPTVDAEMGMAGFEDVDDISDWAGTAMRWAVQNRIINGTPAGLLAPQGLATRAEVAAMMQRFVTLEK